MAEYKLDYTGEKVNEAIKKALSGGGGGGDYPDNIECQSINVNGYATAQNIKAGEITSSSADKLAVGGNVKIKGAVDINIGSESLIINGNTASIEVSDGIYIVRGTTGIPDITAEDSNVYVNDIYTQGSTKSLTEQIGNLSDLTTTDKSSVVGAINEVAQGGGGSTNPLRALFLASGAEYNETDGTGTDEYGNTFNKVAGCYTLNGLGDITEEEMARIYDFGHIQPIYSDNNAVLLLSYFGNGSYTMYNLRTNLPRKGAFTQRMSLYSVAGYSNSLESINLRNHYIDNGSTVITNSVNSAFLGCNRLVSIYSIIDMSGITAQPDANVFKNCRKLKDIKLKNLKHSLQFSDCEVLSNASILYMCTNAANTNAITITLHATAYARATADSDITSACQAHNITLASA